MAPCNTTLYAKTIAIVGAGPSGIIAAKYLRAENIFEKIVLFEQRSRSGGIWNYTPDQRDENLFSIPLTSPDGRTQNPRWKETPALSKDFKRINGTSGCRQTASFLSPMYENLETNIPRGLMGFKDLDWPQDCQLFPKHETVLAYIEEFGRDVQDLVQYETQVINARPISDAPNSQWSIRNRNLRSNQETEERFDALIVANGHFIVPYVPEVPGLKEWDSQYPGTIGHSKYYRRPQDFQAKKVIVVGNSASGADISNQIAKCCQNPLIWSTRSTSLFSATHGSADEAPQERKEYPPIKCLHPSTRSVEFEDGTTEIGIDAILFATGYFYSLPFLADLEPAPITSGTHVQNTYQHLFYSPQPTLSFLALNQRVIPFPIAEAQSAVLARVYAGRMPLPSLLKMQEWEKKRAAQVKREKDFHLLPFPEDGNYINMLSQWAGTAARREGLENDGQGKIPPYWGEWEFWCRENFPAIRRAFGSVGEGRKDIRRIEELGFSFERSQEEKDKNKSA